MKKGLLKYIGVAVLAVVLVTATALIVPNLKIKPETPTEPNVSSNSEAISDTEKQSETGSETEADPDTESGSTFESETSAEKTSESENKSETEAQPSTATPTSAVVPSSTPGTCAPVPDLTWDASQFESYPHVAEGPVKNMIRLGLTYVSRSFGYSLNDRMGANGHFDCSGLIAVLLRDGLGERSIGQDATWGAWDTAGWRSWAASKPVGSTVQIGAALYRVTMRDSYDFASAWAVPGSIVIQYPPENDPSTKMGHASIALGNIPYETPLDVVGYIKTEYGVDVSGVAGGPNVIPMVYAESNHTTWKINANGVAMATCIDNNYASKPYWIEKISIVLVPVS